MLINTSHLVSSDISNNDKTRYLIESNSDYSNYSNTSQEFEPVWITLSLISIIILTIGGNSLVCIAVIRERNLQNTTNYFLTSLAFTDCLVACLVMPLAVIVEFIGHFPLDALACNVWSTFDVCCCTSSIWHMSVMSLDRYLTLRYPLKYGRHKRRSLMAYKIITIWLISFAICLPLFILSLVDSTNVYNEKEHTCFPSNRTFKIYGSVVAFFIPLIIMIVTYALTMSALRQAHTTKKQRYKGRKRMNTVLNIAAMAVRWKRAVNTVEISVEKSQTIAPEPETQVADPKIPKPYGRRRASSLRLEQNLPKPIFVSTHGLNQSIKLNLPSKWHKDEDMQEDSSSLERPTERSLDQYLNPDGSNNLQASAKRSHSCAPLLDVENSHHGKRRSSSIHTLLQIRRDSAKITEELANLAAQLTASMNNDLNTKRPSLSVPGTSKDDEAPTIDQLLAETTVNQPIMIPGSFLEIGPKRRERSHSADIRLPVHITIDDKTTTGINLPIPNLLITHESIPAISNKSADDTTTPSLKFDKTCQRIKDWIAVTTSTTALNINNHSTIPTRCKSAINMNETTPMLNTNQRPMQTLAQLKRFFPHIEQLYGKTTAPNPVPRPPQLLLVDEQVSSAQNFASTQRSSVSSVASSMLRARMLRNNRPSTTSSIGSSSHQSARRSRTPRLIDGMSQASFNMVSLDTDESSSCTSSLTQHSTAVQSIRTGTTSSKSSNSRKKRQRFKDLSKSSMGNERKAMRVLLIIFSIFVMLWTPFFVINLLSCYTDDIHPIIMSVATWLGYCSSCANPIIYTIFSRAFRQAFFNILTCRKVIHSRNSHRLSRQSMAMSTGRRYPSVSKGQTDQH